MLQKIKNRMLAKLAGIPEQVQEALSRDAAFSGEYLKDMGYSVPKGYEVKGDLCCPVEKNAQGRCWEGYKPVPGKEPYSEDSCEPEAKKKPRLEKEATAWREKLRSGELSSRALGTITRAATSPYSAAVFTTVKNSAPEAMGYHKNAPRNVMSRQHLTSGQHAAELRDVVSHPLYSKGLAYRDKGFSYKSNNPNFDLTLTPRDIHPNPGYMTKLDHYYYPMRPNLEAEMHLRNISYGLRSGSMGLQSELNRLFEKYREFLDKREPRDFEALKKLIAENPNDPKLLTLKQLIDAREKRPIETKKIIGISKGIDPKFMKGGAKITMQENEYSPYAVPDLSAINAPLGKGTPPARHEISHIIEHNMSNAERMQLIKRIHETFKRHPRVMRAVADLPDYAKGDMLLPEAAAQLIASRGGSNSANRYISDYRNFAKNSGNKQLLSILNAIDAKDPSGIDQAIISHLLANYNLELPYK